MEILQNFVAFSGYMSFNFKNDETEWMLKVQGVKSMEKKIEELRKKKKAKEEGLIKDKIKEIDDLFQGPGETAQPLVKDSKGIPKPPVIPSTLFGPSVWLDIKLETVTRLQTKHSQMYTFVCAQEFRR